MGITFIVGYPTLSYIGTTQKKRATMALKSSQKNKNSYEAKLDSKKRLTIRGAETEYYHVTEHEDGTVTLSPRVLVHPDQISAKSFRMIEEALDNLNSGKVSESVDMEELKELLKEP